MASEIYLQVDSGAVKGEATAVGFEDQIVLDSFQLGANNPTSIGTGGGAGSGKVTLSNFTVSKRTDTSSVPLFLACCKGTHFENAVVTVRRAGGDQIKFLTYTFNVLFVEDINWSGGAGDEPVETLSFAYGSVEMGYTPQDSKGGEGAEIMGGWDQIKVAAT